MKKFVSFHLHTNLKFGNQLKIAKIKSYSIYIVYIDIHVHVCLTNTIRYNLQAPVAAPGECPLFDTCYLHKMQTVFSLNNCLLYFNKSFYCIQNAYIKNSQ